MAGNIKYESPDHLPYVATGTWTIGVPVLVGTTLIVPLDSATVGQNVDCQVYGRSYLPKTSAQAWTMGQQLYWDAGTSKVTNVQSGVLPAIGRVGEAAANPSSYGYVDLGVGVEADSDMGTFKADLASTGAGKGTALIGDEVSGGTLKAKLDTCATAAAAATAAGQIYASTGATRAVEAIAGTEIKAVAAGTAAAINLSESTGSGVNYAKVKAADTLAANVELVLDADRTLSNVPTMAANGGAGNLLQTAAADKAVSDAGIAVANVATMAAAGGAGELLYTAAADKALAKSGLTLTLLKKLVAGITLPAGPLADGGTNAINVPIQLTDATGANLAHVADFRYTTSAAALGAMAAQVDQATTATTGLIDWDDTVAGGEGTAHTDATGAAVLVVGEVGGPLNTYLNVYCAGQSASVRLEFA